MREQSLDDKLRSIGWTVTKGGCWEWKGPRSSAGYGVFRAAALGFKSAAAHRVMYEHFVRPIPDGLLVRHTCDNPPCVNPEHLIPGTYLDNSRDMLERGRQRKRDEAKIEQARALAAEGNSQAGVAAEMGIPLRTIQSWDIDWPQGRPRLAEGEGSRWTKRRRRLEAQSSGALNAGRDLSKLRAREREMRAAGVPAVEIAVALGVRPETVSRWRRAERAETGEKGTHAGT